MTSRVEHLLEVVLASLAEIHLRIAELEVDVAAARPTTMVLSTTMGVGEEMELDDGVDPEMAVGPPRPRLVVDNGEPADA